MKEWKVMRKTKVKGRKLRLREGGEHVGRGGQLPHVAVLGLLVAPEVHFPLEGPAAHVTRKWLIT